MGVFSWRGKMNKLYFILLFFVLLLLSYYAGVRAAKIDCRANQSTEVIQTQSKIIEIQRTVNDEVINSGVDDIRCILREKYTIAE